MNLAIGWRRGATAALAILLLGLAIGRTIGAEPEQGPVAVTGRAVGVQP